MGEISLHLLKRNIFSAQLTSFPIICFNCEITDLRIYYLFIAYWGIFLMFIIYLSLFIHRQYWVFIEKWIHIIYVCLFRNNHIYFMCLELFSGNAVPCNVYNPKLSSQGPPVNLVLFFFFRSHWQPLAMETKLLLLGLEGCFLQDLLYLAFLSLHYLLWVCLKKTVIETSVAVTIQKAEGSFIHEEQLFKTFCSVTTLVNW